MICARKILERVRLRVSFHPQCSTIHGIVRFLPTAVANDWLWCPNVGVRCCSSCSEARTRRGGYAAAPPSRYPDRTPEPGDQYYYASAKCFTAFAKCFTPGSGPFRYHAPMIGE